MHHTGSAAHRGAVGTAGRACGGTHGPDPARAGPSRTPARDEPRRSSPMRTPPTAQSGPVYQSRSRRLRL